MGVYKKDNPDPEKDIPLTGTELWFTSASIPSGELYTEDQALASIENFVIATYEKKE